MNKEGLEELASVMGGRLNFTLGQQVEYNLSAIPDISEDDIDLETDDESEMDLETASEQNEVQSNEQN